MIEGIVDLAVDWKQFLSFSFSPSC